MKHKFEQEKAWQEEILPYHSKIKNAYSMLIYDFKINNSLGPHIHMLFPLYTKVFPYLTNQNY